MVNIKFSQIFGKPGNQKPSLVISFVEKSKESYRKGMSVIFVKIFLKSMIFVKILWYSEGHQTKPTGDNVHIP